MRIQIDSVQGVKQHGQRMVVPRGSVLSLHGWAIDQAAGTTPAVVVRIDGTIEVRALANERPDVAAHFGDRRLTACGFVARLPAELTYGEHAIRVGRYVGDAFEVVEEFSIACVEAAQEDPKPWPRILIASALKTGSTYTRSVLKAYFGAEDPPFTDFSWLREHDLDSWTVERLRNRAFVLMLHMKAYDENLRALDAEGIVPIVSWRNIADMLVSYDDHLRKEGQSGLDFLFYCLDREYFKLPDQQRYLFLIRYMLPWYVDFHLGWRDYAPAIRVYYEDLAEDPVRYYCELIDRLDGGVDRERLEAILHKKMSYEQQRLNAGVNGRAASKMSSETKAALEDALRAHVEDLSELIRELPWNEGRRAMMATPQVQVGS